METEIIDKLFLELAQVSTARTARELRRDKALRQLVKGWRERAADIERHDVTGLLRADLSDWTSAADELEALIGEVPDET